MIDSSGQTIFGLLVRLWHHLGGRLKLQFTLLLGMMIVSAFAEIVSLGAVLPFLGALVAPEKVFERPVIAKLASIWGITAAQDLVLLFTLCFVFAAVVAAGIRLVVLWLNTHVSFATGIKLSIDMYRRTLYQPYKVHVAKNSNEIISGITVKTSTIATGIVLQTLMLLSSTIVLIAVVLILLLIDPLIAAVSAASFGGGYLMMTLFWRNKLNKNSMRIAAEQTQLFKTLQEGLGGIRDVLLDNTQPVFCDLYHRADSSLRKAQASNTFISASPRFVMEALGMTFIALLAYSISVQKGGLADALPVLGALAMGAQRLIPALQQSYASSSTIRGNAASLVDTLELLDQPLPQEALQPPPQPLAFAKTISFRSVSFRYLRDGPWVIDNLSFEIPKGARLGFVGATGSGKSTALDLLMGLLEPTNGEILVDGQSIVGTSRRAWQRNIAHVPQSVYLADAPVAANIAFGISREEIDMKRVVQAAQQAQISEFIESQPDCYETFVGERGVRLSGGQRQRIGIARALYKKANVLIFDEATSALDTLTEQAVMEAIDNLDRELTILIIAHRLTTVRRCDLIIELGHGRSVAQGTYDQLFHGSPSFREMASATTGS